RGSRRRGRAPRALVRGAPVTTSRVGLGFDVHPFAAGGVLVLGGVELEGPALAGHSDADAVAHAVADALLGAAGLPDLRTLFPADHGRYPDASPVRLVRARAGPGAAP